MLRYFACMHVCVPHWYLGGQMRSLYPWEVELQMVVIHQVGTRKQISNSGRAASAHKDWSVSPPLSIVVWEDRVTDWAYSSAVQLKHVARDLWDPLVCLCIFLTSSEWDSYKFPLLLVLNRVLKSLCLCNNCFPSSTLFTDLSQFFKN